MNIRSAKLNFCKALEFFLLTTYSSYMPASLCRQSLGYCPRLGGRSLTPEGNIRYSY